jgi:hypothetical protein
MHGHLRPKRRHFFGKAFACLGNETIAPQFECLNRRPVQRLPLRLAELGGLGDR